MHRLLTTSLLLTGCALQPAVAQKATQSHQKPLRTTVTQRATDGLPVTTVTEFCLNYPRYYFNLPAQYRLNAYSSFQAAGLTLTPEVKFTTELAQSSALREVAYKSLYYYCDDIRFMYRKPADELLFSILYETLHMNAGPATLLAQYCKQHYKLLPTTTSPPSNSTQSSNLDAPQPVDGRSATTSTPSLEQSGWHVQTIPHVALLDDTPGYITFRIKVNASGQAESVTKVAGSVSLEQEQAFREALLQAHFANADPKAAAAVGTYTYRYSVR